MEVLSKLPQFRMSGMKTECRKFQPNIFNKTKCTHCFKPKEEHSAEALENNRATRKVSKCGYLFVAPDWDFSNPLNRTKRWQRRWFVLYDDGELTYSVDEHADTVPQAVIDMNLVMEVTDGEEVTGNPFSLAITAPDRVHFIKGTCREESRWWYDVLSIFPRNNTKSGRHKRNATFPGGKATTILQPTQMPGTSRVTKPYETPPLTRPRYNSCQTETLVRSSESWQQQKHPSIEPDDVFPTKEPVLREIGTNTGTTPEGIIVSKTEDSYTGGHPPTSESPPTHDKVKEGKVRTKRVIRREVRGVRTVRSNSENLSTVITPDFDKDSDVSRHLLFEEYDSNKREEKLKDIADSITRPRANRSLSFLESMERKQRKTDDMPTRERDTSDDLSSATDEGDHVDKPVRGDPDGCGLDPAVTYNNNSELRVDLPAEDLLHIKKGWLMKQTLTKEWNKYWFVLRGTAIMYYRDPSAEDNGILDGIIDLSLVQRIEQADVARNYGFIIVTWDEKKYLFSAATASIRINWIEALRNAANIKEQNDRPPSLGERLEKEIANIRSDNSAIVNKSSSRSSFSSLCAEKENIEPVDFVSSPRSMMSSDDEYRTASETSMKDGLEDYCEWVEGDLSRSTPTLIYSPPSPLNRTAISKVKEKSRSRSNSRSSTPKRSRSSPPSSRQSTRDDYPSISKEDLASSFSDKDSVSVPSLSDFDDKPEKDKVTCITPSGESMLVELLETEVESLKAQLEHTQGELVELHQSNLDLSTQLRSQDNVYSLHDMETEHKVFQNQVSGIKHTLEASREKLCKQGAEIEDLQQKLQLSESSLESTIKEAEKSRQEQDLLDEENEKLKNHVLNLEEQVQQLIVKLETKEHNLQEKNDRIQEFTELRQRYSELVHRYSNLHQQLTQSESLDAEWKGKYEKLEEKYSQERKEWEEKIQQAEIQLTELVSSRISQEDKDDIIENLHTQLSESERKVNELFSKIEKLQIQNLEDSERYENQIMNRDAFVDHLKEDVASLKEENCSLKADVKSEKSEVMKLKDLIHELRVILEERSSENEEHKSEVLGIKSELDKARKELEEVSSRLQSGIAENELLSAKVQELEGRLSRRSSVSNLQERSASRRSLSHMDSLSDLSSVVLEVELEDMESERLIEEYSNLRCRFEKAIHEIRILKRELKDSHNNHDELELSYIKLQQDMKSHQDEVTSETNLMSQRIQDLTNKLTASDKQVRQLKQKMSKLETRDRRRTQSLKGREAFTISKEVEIKLKELESKFDEIEKVVGRTEGGEVQDLPEIVGDSSHPPRRSPSFDSSTKSSRLRRKSLDSATGSEPLKVLSRLTSLEARVSRIGASIQERTSSHCSPKQSVVKVAPPAQEENFHMETVEELSSVISTAREHMDSVLLELDAVKFGNSTDLSIVQNKLQNLQEVLKVCDKNIAVAADSRRTVECLVSRLQNLLTTKISDLQCRRQELVASGNFGSQNILCLMAEKVAYETVIFDHLAHIVKSASSGISFERDRLLRELFNVHRMITSLKDKVTGDSNNSVCGNFVDSAADLLVEKLLIQGKLCDVLSSTTSTYVNEHVGPVCSETTVQLAQARLQEEEQILNEQFSAFKSQKLHELAAVLAFETVRSSGSSEGNSGSEDSLIEEDKIQEAWTMAQTLVNENLVSAEIAHTMNRFAKLYEKQVALAKQTNLYLKSAQHDIIEKQYQIVEDTLQQEMEEAVLVLSSNYEACLNKMRSGQELHVDVEEIDPEHALQEFADVMAHKALLDGHLIVMQIQLDAAAEKGRSSHKEDVSELVADAVDLEKSLLWCSPAEPSAVKIGVINEAEFSFLFQKFQSECKSQVASLLSSSPSECDLQLKYDKAVEEMVSVKETYEHQLEAERSQFNKSILLLEKELDTMKTKEKEQSPSRRRASQRKCDAEAVCSKCEELQRELKRVKRNAELQAQEEKKLVPCVQCKELQNQLKSLIEQHKQELTVAKQQHDLEVADIRGEQEQILNRLEATTSGTNEELRSQVEILEHRLQTLELEYESQIKSLRETYENTLKCHRDSSSEESIRQRYQTEIEQLRSLCEKGLGAMENSHRRIIAELEEKHRREREQLQAEKEQALAEETQATLAALDAMRKAHESEVQREIAKFKEEFIRKMQSTHDIGAMHKEHEAEMEDVKKEILSLSEKYSIKCVETASLEEHLTEVTKQLNDANKQIFDLDARNKQLRAHLASEISALEASDKSDVQKLLQLKDSQLVLKQEEVSNLTMQLQAAHGHEEELGTLCRQLSHYLQAERQLRTDEVGSLRDKLERIILAEGHHRRSNSFTRGETPSKSGNSSNHSSNTDLVRSPSCPRLSGFTSFLSVAPLSSGPHPQKLEEGGEELALSGMVASRKKVFEMHVK